MTGKISLGLAVIGICFFIPINSNAVNPGSATTDMDNLLMRPVAKVSMFIDSYPANRFIHSKSSSSFTSADVFAGPYKLLATPPTNKDSSLEVYGMLFASLGLMALIGHRRLTNEVE
jgi:hypothetical protein